MEFSLVFKIIVDYIEDFKNNGEGDETWRVPDFLNPAGTSFLLVYHQFSQEVLFVLSPISDETRYQITELTGHLLQITGTFPLLLTIYK
jgi:hypothetical protein